MEKEVDGVNNSKIKLHLKSLNLKAVPTDVLSQRSLTHLCLDYNELQTLPREFCTHLPNLTFLSLNGNELDNLPADMGVLLNLKELYLNENYLNYLPESVVKLTNLEKLYIVGNLLKELPNDIEGLKSLKELSVDENFITSLPEDFGRLKSLERLEASNNKIEFLPENFGSLTKLVSLNLSHNVLKTLPSTFGMLPSVAELDISENKISRLPDVFLSAQYLHKLFIENNNLTSIPHWFGDIKNMLELSLKDNCLMGFPLPEMFGSVCTKLVYFDLSGNNVESLPNSFGELKHLKFFDAGSSLYELERNRNVYNGNLLTNLPQHFGNLINLCELHLDENYLKELPANFGCLINLKFLDLNHNNLEVLPENFGNLHSLKVCLMSLNDLQYLPSSFGNLLQLEELSLDNNRISKLPESFCNLTKLKTLDLYKNSLTEVPQVLKFLINLTHLDLGENNFGVPIDQVPEIMYKPTYVTNPEKKDNWRGRPRLEFSNPDQTMDSELNEDEKMCNNLHLSKEKLHLALKNAKFREKHVANDSMDIQKEALNFRKVVTLHGQNEEEKQGEKDDISKVQACNEEMGINCIEKDSSDSGGDIEQNTTDINCYNHNALGTTTQECWDDEFIDIAPYVSIEVGSDSDKEGEEDLLSETDFVDNSSQVNPPEDWDAEVENNPYDDESVTYCPLPLQQPQFGPFRQAFVPSDIHALPFQRNCSSSTIEDGQFDDADL